MSMPPHTPIGRSRHAKPEAAQGQADGPRAHPQGLRREGKGFHLLAQPFPEHLSAHDSAGFGSAEAGRVRVTRDRAGVLPGEKRFLKNYEAFDDVELALIVALKNTVGQLGAPFQKPTADLFTRLYQATGEPPVFVKIDGSVPLDGRLFSRIVRAIQARKEIYFNYEVYSPYRVRTEPYRVVHFEGFWYVVARDKTSGVIKQYALDKIKNFKTLGKCFKWVPLDLDRTLEESANIWFSETRHIEVLVEVDSSCAHYFKRRKMFPTQEIRPNSGDTILISPVAYL